MGLYDLILFKEHEQVRTLIQQNLTAASMIQVSELVNHNQYKMRD